MPKQGCLTKDTSNQILNKLISYYIDQDHSGLVTSIEPDDFGTLISQKAYFIHAPDLNIFRGIR